MANETTLFEVRCTIQFRNSLYMRMFFWPKKMPSGITSWPFGNIQMYKDRIDIIPFPATNTGSIMLNNIESVKNMFFSTVITLKNPELPKYLILQTFSYVFPNLLYSKLKGINEKYNLGIRFD